MPWHLLSFALGAGILGALFYWFAEPAVSFRIGSRSVLLSAGRFGFVVPVVHADGCDCGSDDTALVISPGHPSFIANYDDVETPAHD